MSKWPAHVTMVGTEQARRNLAYQLQEDLEKTAERLGHSPLHRARELTAVQEFMIQAGLPAHATAIAESLSKVRWCSKETEVTVLTIRTYLRVLRRLSMAVENQANPCYDGSALMFFERLEELWGRKSVQTTMNENLRTLDAFQAALPDLDDLRNAAETYFILLLRGAPVRIGVRNVAENARALVMYNKAAPQRHELV